MVITSRGPGQFIGEVSLFEGHSGDAVWKTCVRARVPVKALLLTRGHLRTLLQSRPEAEIALRAGLHLPRHASVTILWRFQRVPQYRTMLARQGQAGILWNAQWWILCVMSMYQTVQKQGRARSK